jgi:hypothetical protein
VYVPATVAILRALAENGEIDPMSRTAFAVTGALREAYSAGDEEELEAVAHDEAALASLRLLAAEADSGEPVYRRAVISADVDEAKPRPDLDDAVVRLSAPIELRQVAAIHVDLPDAEADVRKASEVIDAADLGDPDAEFAVGDAEGHPLAWYAPEELPFLLELM